MATLSAVSIHKSFPTRSGPLVVLDDVSLTLTATEPLVITGPSGSGKSTLLNILGTLDRPTSGTVTVDGGNPFDLPPRKLAHFRNKRIGFVFQDHHLLPQCTALENVLLPTMASGANHAESEDRARALLDRVKLGDRLSHFPAELSGGERQRVAIARALINSPAILLVDEPTGNLDRATAKRVADLLFELQRDEQVAMLAVTHSDELSARFAKRLEMVDGKLVEG